MLHYPKLFPLGSRDHQNRISYSKMMGFCSFITESSSEASYSCMCSLPAIPISCFFSKELRMTYMGAYCFIPTNLLLNKLDWKWWSFAQGQYVFLVEKNLSTKDVLQIINICSYALLEITIQRNKQSKKLSATSGYNPIKRCKCFTAGEKGLFSWTWKLEYVTTETIGGRGQGNVQKGGNPISFKIGPETYLNRNTYFEFLGFS